ncbi:MAG: terminase small subunit [Selenomonadaceae bacterium]|nr:terminase small subunit [Selenomonadaceae bacterium]
MSKMTERQKRFVDAYIQTGNASESARQAGYSQRGITVTAAKLLVKTSIRAEIDCLTL